MQERVLHRRIRSANGYLGVGGRASRARAVVASLSSATHARPGPPAACAPEAAIARHQQHPRLRPRGFVSTVAAPSTMRRAAARAL
jgi:hypothetical protein